MVFVAGAVLQAGSGSSSARALDRIIGTIPGIAIFGLIEVLDPAGLLLVGILASLQFAAEVTVARHYALAQMFITPIALTVAATGGTGGPWSLVAARLVDTAAGAMIAMVVVWASRRIMVGGLR